MIEQKDIEAAEAEMVSAKAVYDRETLPSNKPALWGDYRAKEAALRDLISARAAELRQARLEARRADLADIAAAVRRGEEGAAEFVTISRQAVNLVTQLGKVVREWEATRATVRAALVAGSEADSNRLDQLLADPEPALAGLLALAVPGLADQDLAFWSRQYAKVDWPGEVETRAGRAVTLLRTQLVNDEPEAA